MIMRVLPPVVIAASALFLLGVTGCSQFDKALGQQQALVSFTPGVSNKVRLQVRSACGKLPNVHPQPIPTGVPLTYALNQIVFQIDNAGATDITRLSECVTKYSAGASIDIQDSSDNGG
jgi:hypothetical protein